jgi:hypothetical protein
MPSHSLRYDVSSSDVAIDPAVASKQEWNAMLASLPLAHPLE